MVDGVGPIRKGKRTKRDARKYLQTPTSPCNYGRGGLGSGRGEFGFGFGRALGVRPRLSDYTRNTISPPYTFGARNLAAASGSPITVSSPPSTDQSNMVAISMYRGNLHRVPDVPRRWLMPNRSLSLKSFKSLLNRRSKALSLVRNPNPNPNTINNPSADVGPSGSGEGKIVESGVAKEGDVGSEEEAGNASKGDEFKEDLSAEVTPEVLTAGFRKMEVSEGKKKKAAEVAVAAIDQPVDIKYIDPITREKRKKEIEEKLLVLNERKHNLVQVLKQILNAEEELKRRSSMQSRAPPPLQVDVGNDSASMNRQATPRIGSEASLASDLEGGDSRPILRMSSASPSPDSVRRPALSQHNPLQHPARTNLVSGSPSRFAPPGHPSVPANLPSVSVPGTSNAASSPSPATSGRTPASKDSRLPSPWN